MADATNGARSIKDEPIGFIGVGTMGTPMVRNLINAGFTIVAYDVAPAARERAAQLGARVVQSPREVGAQCRVVLTILPTSAEVESVALGPDGLVEGFAPGSVLVDMTSGYPPATHKIGAALAERGFHMLDAPVSGGRVGAEAATLAVMVGGDVALYEEVRPILSAIGKNVFHVGPLGAGHAMKALNNLLSATCLAATCEAAAIAAKMGLSVERFIQVVQASSGRSSASDDKFPRFILPRTFNAGFTAGLMLKDLNIATDLGRAYKVPLFIAAEVQQLYAALVNQRGAQEDVTGIMRLIEELAQTTVAGEQVAQRA